MKSSFDLERYSGTDSPAISLPAVPLPTMPTVTWQFGELRDQATALSMRVGQGHRDAQTKTLELLSEGLARLSPRDLLRRLSDEYGLSWSTIADLIGVSVQAVRKWRTGDAPSPERRLALARLVAFLDVLEDSSVGDPGGWLELPVMQGYAPTHFDLYKTGRADLLCDLASGRLSGSDALDEYQADWREALRLENEVFLAEDGQPSIRRIG